MHFTHPPLPAIEQHAATVPVNAVVPPVAAMPREKGQHTLPKLQSHKVKVSRIASQKLSGIVPRRRSDERAPAKAMHDHRPLSSAAKPEMPSSSPRPIQHSQAHVAKHAYVEADPADVLDIFSKSKHANRTDNAPFNLEPAKDSTSDALMNTGSRTIIGGEHEGPQPTHSASTSPLSESRQDQPANESYVEPQEDAQQHAHQAIEPSVADVERSTTSQKQPKISTDKFSTDHEASGSLERGQPIGGSSDGRESLSPHPAVPKTKLGRPAQPTRPQRSFPRLQPQSRQPPVLHRPSSRRGPVKVTKSRPATKPNPPPATVRPPAATVPSVGDVFRILQWTMENEQKQSATEAEDRYRAHQSELAELKASEAGKKFRLEALEMEKSSLADQLRLAKSNIRDYEEKVAKLTRFVNGLANDQEKLLEEHKTFRNRCDELILESKTRIEERKQLTEYFQDCLTRSGNIKDLISRAAREAKAELRGVELRSEEFLKQLEEKDDLLQEEKRRIQELQEQLNKAIEAHNNFGELLDEKFNLVSQKLDSMQQEIMTIVVAGTAKPELESLGTQIKELCSKPISSPTELEKVEGALQQLSERYDFLPVLVQGGSY